MKTTQDSQATASSPLPSVTGYAARILRSIIALLIVWLLILGSGKLIGHQWMTGDEIYWYFAGYIWAIVANIKRLAA